LQNSQSIDWTAEQKGPFFIETFVWDENNVSLGAQEFLAQILVN